MQSKLHNALDILSSWSEGFVLTFVFSDDAPDANLEANVLSWEADATIHQVVEKIIEQLAATRAVVLDLRACGEAVLRDVSRRLNERRALLERIPHPVLFVCSPRNRMLVQQAAPDLWHIRTMVPEAAA
jgi:hypothetical protein